jgi:hypothetical protein
MFDNLPHPLDKAQQPLNLIRSLGRHAKVIVLPPRECAEAFK